MMTLFHHKSQSPCPPFSEDAEQNVDRKKIHFGNIRLIVLLTVLRQFVLMDMYISL